MNLKNLLLTLIMMSGVSSSVLAEEIPTKAFSNDQCLAEAARNYGSSISCSQDWKLLKIFILPTLPPIAMEDRTVIQPRVTIDQTGAHITVSRHQVTLTNLPFMVFGMYIPAFAMMLVGIMNGVKNDVDTRWHVVVLYTCIIITVLLMGVLGDMLRLKNDFPVFLLGCCIGGFMSAGLANYLSKSPACIVVIGVAGTLAAGVSGAYINKLGMRNAAIVEYLLFLTAVSVVGIILCAVAARIKPLLKSKRRSHA